MVVVLLGGTVDVVVDSAAWRLVTGAAVVVDEVVVEVASASSPEQAPVNNVRTKTQFKA